ncbi:MAG: DNA mismatch repair endonuclease MutL [Candidatus Eisenbacteria bacterium]
MKIKTLPPDVVKKIAAGEVIERPASVVKELVENSIDAGATQITVRLGDPLYSEITVSDDGAGMSREDALLSLERHSTSKLLGEADLLGIRTLGFRGEALPSIAQVSRLVLTTRDRDGLSGTLVRCLGGEIEEVVDAGRAPGTTVTVSDLFFNTPVRRRFLRSRITELRHIIRIITSYALAFENIRFVLRQTERELLNLPAAEKLFDRMVSLYGLETSERFLPVDSDQDGVRIHGFVGGGDLSRTTAEYQLFFVNRRWVSNSTLAFGVREAYSGLLPRDRFPMCVILIDSPPDGVDVNVHPTKREVRFANEGWMRDLVFRLVRETLRQASGMALASIERPGGASLEILPQDSSVTRVEPVEYAAGGGQLSFVKEEPGSLAGGIPGAAGESVMVALWQLHGTFVLAQTKGGLVIIDQHAAHERILYEDARRTLAQGSPSSQQLLFPLIVDLSPDEFQVLLDIEAHLRRLGFDMRSAGGSRIVVKGIPPGLRGWREGQLLHDMVDAVMLPGGSTPLEERVARALACHAAVKANSPLSLEEMNYLIDRLFGTSMPQGDPHGRPTFITLSLDEIEHRFGRT